LQSSNSITTGTQTTTSLKEERRKYDDQNRKETEKQGTNRSRNADIFCDAKYESRGKEGTSRKKQHQKKGVKIVSSVYVGVLSAALKMKNFSKSFDVLQRHCSSGAFTS